MALTQTQGYKDYNSEGIIYNSAASIIRLKNNLAGLKAALVVVAAEVAGDANADADLKTLAAQADNFVNNVKFTDFISFVTNSLE